MQIFKIATPIINYMPLPLTATFKVALPVNHALYVNHNQTQFNIKIISVTKII